MLAAQFRRYVGFDELEVREAPEPHAGSGQVRVLAAAVDPIDCRSFAATWAPSWDHRCLSCPAAMLWAWSTEVETASTVWWQASWSTARPQHHSALRALGAQAVPYGPGLAERVAQLAPGGVSAGVDASGASLADLVAIVGNPQHVVTVTDPLGAQRLSTQMRGGEDDARLLAVAAS